MKSPFSYPNCIFVISIIATILLSTTGCEPSHSPRGPAQQNEPVADEQIHFELVATTILRPHCVRCHNSQTTKGGVNLETLDDILKTDGLVNFNSPQDSLLLAIIRSVEMPPPPRAAVPDRDIFILERWLALGLPHIN